MSASISVHTRKRLWTRADDECAYPGCTQHLLEPTVAGDDDTVVGKECHIVAQRDNDPSVARSLCLLTEDEKRDWAHLIKYRHHYDNLVLMCGVHSDIIDDPKQGISIGDLVQFKRAHEQEVAARRRARRAASAQSAEDTADEPKVARPLLLDDVGFWQRKAVLALSNDEPEALEWLLGEVGDPVDPGRVKDLMARWHEAIDGRSDLVAVAVIRHAEAVGLWSQAGEGWEQYAARAHDDRDRADRLVRAAIDSQAAGDDGRRERLLADAEKADPDSPRLHLERTNAKVPPVEQLELLNEIETDDQPLAALIACAKALTSLLLPDLDAAEEHLARAKQLDPESMAIRATEINIRVQRARIALISDQTFSLADVLSTQTDALSLREEMIAMGRWSESGRLLMLAADISGMLRDLDDAERLLKEALPEEVSAPDGAVVLGEAALRSGASQLAIEYTENAVPNDAITRIRAAANVDLGGPARTTGLNALEKLALSDSPEREQAAAERLVACMHPVRAPWNEEVAEVLAQSQHADMAARLRPMVFASTGNFREAERLAGALPNDAASAEVRLRVAAMRGQYSGMKDAAEKFLQFGPDATGRLLAANALAKAGERDGAGQITAQIAHDPNSPPTIRANAYATLLQTLADRDLWEDADREWKAFQRFANQELRVGDGRVSAWQVRILHHRS